MSARSNRVQLREMSLYKSNWKSDIIQHVDAQHEGIKHKCDQWDYAADWKSGLKKHVQAQHKGLTYNCEICDYKTTGLSLVENLPFTCCSHF